MASLSRQSSALCGGRDALLQLPQSPNMLLLPSAITNKCAFCKFNEKCFFFGALSIWMAPHPQNVAKLGNSNTNIWFYFYFVAGESLFLHETRIMSLKNTAEISWCFLKVVSNNFSKIFLQIYTITRTNFLTILMVSFMALLQLEVQKATY